MRALLQRTVLLGLHAHAPDRRPAEVQARVQLLYNKEANKGENDDECRAGVADNLQTDTYYKLKYECVAHFHSTGLVSTAQ